MEYIDFLALNDFVNHNYYVDNSLQGKRRAVHLDEFDFGKIKSIE